MEYNEVVAYQLYYIFYHNRLRHTFLVKIIMLES
jgi:hypothetical protein